MRSFAVIGGKGGVGKTTVTSNVSAFLASLGYKVIAVDGNLTTPNLGLHLGLHLAPVTIHDVLKGEDISKAIYPHPLGIKVLPGSLSFQSLKDLDPSRLSNILSAVKGDYLFIDSAAGLGREALTALGASEETLIVTNPEITAVADALRTIKLAETLGKKITGIVLNRVGRKRHELSRVDVESMLSYPVIAEIPEDPSVPESIANRLPVVVFKPNSPAAIELKNLALAIAGFSFRFKPSFWQRLFSWR